MTQITDELENASPSKPVQTLQKVTIRLAGDSGDGMQLAGTKFTSASVIFGNDVSTLPDYPAEIRAPAGTLAGVSGFQIQFSSMDIHTPGDELDALIVMNPAALRVNLKDLKKGGILVANSDSFTKTNLKKAGYETNPLEDGSLREYITHPVNISTMNREVVEKVGDLSSKQADLTKNFFALGLISWLYDRPLDPTINWIKEKFQRVPKIADANVETLKAGFYYGETAELFHVQYRVPPAEMSPGMYRRISGNDAIALGILAGAELSGLQVIYSGYPITPASDILHELSKYKHMNVATFQAEDELAAIGAAIGASFGGSMGVTGTSGPGVALKGESLGLAMILELPLIIFNVQRGGPSTGMPTKLEQSDLFQALYGRNGEAPMPVLAAQSAADCFDITVEAFRIAVKYMTPVFILSDSYLGNSSDPWKIPDLSTYERIEVKHPTSEDAEDYLPYQRDVNLARPWAIPGTKGLEHRIGGLEKKENTGDVSYDPLNHEKMVLLRQEKVDRVVHDIPPLGVNGPKQGDLLVLGWGSTQGAIYSAVKSLQNEGYAVASAHLRYLNPFPSNLGEVLRSYKRVLVPELNLGQLRTILRAKYLLDVEGFNKVQGKPFQVREIEEKVLEILHSIQQSEGGN